MIVTVTCNPSLDQVIEVLNLSRDDSVRIESQNWYAGGKGVDASRVIVTLGGNTIATGFLGGANGLHLKGLLLNEGVNCDFIRSSEQTRSNIIIFTKEGSKDHIALNSKGPNIAPHELALLFEKIESLARLRPSFVLLGGSLPKGVTETLYAQIIYNLRSLGIKVALDADNQALKLAIKEKPTVIKPNTHEFRRLVGKKVESENQIIRAGQDFLKAGLEIILVSRGSKGLLVFNKEEAFRIEPPKIEVNSTVGSGDSTLAAFLLGLEKGKNIAESGIMAAAAGAATAMSLGVELVQINDYQNIIQQVSCTKINLES